MTTTQKYFRHGNLRPIKQKSMNYLFAIQFVFKNPQGETFYTHFTCLIIFSKKKCFSKAFLGKVEIISGLLINGCWHCIDCFYKGC